MVWVSMNISEAMAQENIPPAMVLMESQTNSQAYPVNADPRAWQVEEKHLLYPNSTRHSRVGAAKANTYTCQEGYVNT